MTVPEQWAPMPGFPNYEISSHGRVHSKPRGGKRSRIVKQQLVSGYLRVSLRNPPNRSATGVLVHRAVLEAFIGPAPQGREAAHLDGNRTNNSVDNLCWVTRKENHSHKIVHGTAQRGERASNVKLTEEQVIRIRTELKSDYEWGDLLGISWKTVKRARQGQTWAHLTTPPVKLKIGTRITSGEKAWQKRRIRAGVSV
jgi:hypothetical protein